MEKSNYPQLRMRDLMKLKFPTTNPKNSLFIIYMYKNICIGRSIYNSNNNKKITQHIKSDHIK